MLTYLLTLCTHTATMPPHSSWLSLQHGYSLSDCDDGWLTVAIESCYTLLVSYQSSLLSLCCCCCLWS